MTVSCRFKTGTMFGPYKVERLIGQGTFGQVYLVNDVGTPDFYALKVENPEYKKDSLENEIELLSTLEDSPYIPKLITSGHLFGSQYYVMELLGSSVAAMRMELDSKRFSKYTTIFIALEMLKCIKNLHSYGYIHRDIKPANFMIRPGKNNPICLVDFGLSMSYIDRETQKHISFRNDTGFVGSKRYASINAHDRNQLSRRDDLISWFYSCVELYAGTLPWTHTNSSKSMYTLKKETKPSDLCINLPTEFQEIYRRIRNLRFEDEPPYDFIIRNLEKLINNIPSSNTMLDWEYFSDERIALVSAVKLNTNNEDDDSYYRYCRIF